jgi:UDP-N-acetyl-D-mannosaminuronic acid transferase (WecB/TagA/CpsF family)
MKTQLNDVILRNSVDSASEVPAWVREMGLEWLYKLLSKSDSWSAARLG